MGQLERRLAQLEDRLDQIAQHDSRLRARAPWTDADTVGFTWLIEEHIQKYYEGDPAKYQEALQEAFGGFMGWRDEPPIC